MVVPLRGRRAPREASMRVSPLGTGRWNALLLAVLSSVALVLCAPLSRAAAIPHGTVDLVAEQKWLAAGHAANLGLRFQLEQGWHVYWINPGDSGEPPRVKWQLPQGLAVGQIAWPAPRRLGTASVVDFGYEDSVMLLVPIHANSRLESQHPAQLGAQVSVLVCREMCIPGKAQLSLTLPVRSDAPQTDPQTEELFAATRKSLPRATPSNWKFHVRDTKDSFLLTASIGHPTTQATFYPLLESQVDNAAPQKLVPQTDGFRLTLRKSDQLLKPIKLLKGVLVLSADEAYVIEAPIAKSRAVKESYDSRTLSARSLEEVYYK